MSSPSAITVSAYDDGAVDQFQPGGRSLSDYLGVLRRRRTALLGSFLALMVVVVGVAFGIPPVYRSTATILIKEQEIPQELVRSTVTSYADERIQVITQQVMTRATLLDLVDRYGLYGKARQRETSEEILDRMRRDIKLTPISAEVTDRRSGSQVRATIAFSLSYDSEVPSNAQKIANELTTLFLNENVKIRQAKAAETTSFLDEELGRLVAHITQLEQSLSDFKRRHLGSLPDVSLSSQFTSERLSGDLQRIDRDIAFLQDRKSLLERQLADTRPFVSPGGSTGTATLDPEDRLRMLQSQLTATMGIYSEDHPDVRRLRREIGTLKAETKLSGDAVVRDEQMQRLRNDLATLRQKYSDDHPDVVRLRRSFDTLLQATSAASAAGGEPAGAGAPRPERRPDNPVYTNLKSQIETTQAQIENLRAEKRDRTLQLRQVDARLSQMPAVEREWLELSRDLDSSRVRYREMREKQLQAQVAEQLERGRKAERFTLIEPPVFPEKPYRPNRSLILLLGMLLAVGGGFATVALRETLDARIHGTRQLVQILPVPVLGVLPALSAPVDTRQRRQRRWLWLMAASVVAALAGTLFHLLWMPIDVAWFALLRRLAGP